VISRRRKHFEQGNRRLHSVRAAVHSRRPLPADRRCGLASTYRRRTEPQTEPTCTKNLLKIAHVVLEISCRTDRQTDTQTHTDALITIASALEGINDLPTYVARCFILTPPRSNSVVKFIGQSSRCGCIMHAVD